MLTLAELKETLHYDPDTGFFRWLRPPSLRARVHAGQIAGSSSGTGYVAISLNKRRYPAHRLAWLYVHGHWPPDQIDHINGIRSDNRLSNLREATRKQNLRNTKRRSDNTSGFKGVSWCSRSERWLATIQDTSGQRRNLGRFERKEDAAEAYRISAEREFKEFARMA